MWFHTDTFLSVTLLGHAASDVSMVFLQDNYHLPLSVYSLESEENDKFDYGQKTQERT